MVRITLPDGSHRKFSQSVSLYDVAEDIGAGLARVVVAGSIDGKLHDLSDQINNDAQIKLLTLKDQEGVEIMRHTCAHLFGHALKQLHPNAKMAIGPVIDNGFYYDIELDSPLNPEDLKIIEQRMVELARTDYAVEKIVTPRNDAIECFTQRNEPYKLALIEDLKNETEFALYHHQEYIDMCIGPHLPRMGLCKAFKLTHLAGAYWRGDSKNKMLQRIYGIAFTDKKQLNAHLEMLAEAEKRDHRKIGKALKLFHMQEEAPGIAFWHAKGLALLQQVEQYMREQVQTHDYREVRTPLILDRSLWERSGHWEKFSDDMFTTSTENRDYAVKPMNCPGHVQIFNQQLHSYRELPIRIAEFGHCHRNEASGTLHGLMRARSFIQDDGHVFCTHQQLASEVKACMKMIFDVYHDFGFDQVELKLSTRPEKRVGSDAVWDEAEQALQAVLNDSGVEWTLQPGEGAFYGPKIEFSLRDCINRVWQCGTIQVDFSMPDRLNARYIDEAGQRQVPVMIHRAILGSLERFIGILIEQYEGRFPLWLAPVQAVVMTITEAYTDYALEVKDALSASGLRVQMDLRNEKIGYKIRENTLQKIPYQIIIGKQELANKTITLRHVDGRDMGEFELTNFIQLVQTSVQNREQNITYLKESA